MSDFEKNGDLGKSLDPENVTQGKSKADIEETNKFLERCVINEIRGTRIALFVCILQLLLLNLYPEIKDDTAQKLLSIFFVLLLIILSFKKTKIIFDPNSVKKMSNYTFYLIIFWATMVIYHLSVSNRFLLWVWSLTPHPVNTFIYFYLSLCFVLAILLCILVPLILRKEYSREGAHYYLSVTTGYLLATYSFFANLISSGFGAVCLVLIFVIYRQILSLLSILDREDVSEYPDFRVESNRFLGKTTFIFAFILFLQSLQANKPTLYLITPLLFAYTALCIEHLLTYFLTKKYESINHING